MRVCGEVGNDFLKRRILEKTKPEMEREGMIYRWKGILF